MAIIADRIGSHKLMRYTMIAIAILIIPIFMLLISGDIYLVVFALSLMTILLCAFQAPIFAATVNAISHHEYRASFTAVILGSAAGIVGGTTPALMTLLTKITNEPLAPAILIALFAIIAFIVTKNISQE
jgi:MHS family proline/betaine transporter-like MFS transporter